jgi:hypothetical protein
LWEVVGTVRWVTTIFEEATAVSRLSVATSAAGDDVATFAGEVHPGWDIAGNANGGYLLAIAARAMAEAVERPPVTITAHYLRPAGTGPCEITVTTARVGRRFATATASLVLSVDGERREIMRLLGTFGEQAVGGPSLITEGPVDLPAYDDCAPPLKGSEGPKPALQDRLASRLHPVDDGFREGRPSGEPRMRGWFAHADQDQVDAFGLLLATDAFPPAIFNASLPVAWAPTVELTAHVRGVPVPGPLACSFRSRFIHDGLLEEDGEIWDSAGTLVAQSRQLALVPRP